ncbi:MAG: pilus assembly protein CpaC [Candidatus Liberibacter europaeus]|uniref:Pilus assembly protein CpaC n=1 Tax=Candidatus Liberibacter europaeus TaxID=744859 RepID=A0A2T4VXJ4_9HYPH|nr:pilus assembly protein CpaC [Candidatus Liberibacter europaeus]PTL86496.1 MAG: pilus assembly protein CpaC [Candidatus Liberibacter europaeus]
MINLQRTFVVLVVFFFINTVSVLARLEYANSDVGLKNKSAVIKVVKSELSKSKKISVVLNRVIVLEMPSDVQDVLVSDPSKMDVVVHTPKVIYIFGKDIGQANIILLGNDGKEILNLNVCVERDVASLEATLRRFIADSKIRVEMMSNTVVLHGIVKSAQDYKRAVDLTNAFLSKEVLSGVQNNVINLLNIDGSDQVTLKVTIAEVRRDILRQIGFNHTIKHGGSAPATMGIDILTESGNTFSIGKLINHFALTSLLRALENSNSIRTLAEPTLTAISGQKASFNSGGKRFYKSIDKQGGSTFTSEQYGVMLDFTPTVLSSGRIGLRIQTEISEPLGTNTDARPPEYRTRKADTSVELPSGGTIVLAGLLKDDINSSRSETPLLSKIPILGALFRSYTIEKSETEIFIAATPLLVKPVGMHELSRPDDNYVLEDNFKSLFLNRINKIYGAKEASYSTEKSYKGAIGFIYK